MKKSKVNKKTFFKKNPILITGIHNSGSTWIGKILTDSSKQLQYIPEPFNLKKHPNSPLKYWYEYIHENTPEQKKNEIKRYILKYHYFSISRLVTNMKKAKYLGQIKEALVFETNCFTSRAMYKDPIAFMAAEWFYKELNSQVIVSIRHPAAFVSSIKIREWFFDFNVFLEQKNLINDYLAEFQTEMEIIKNAKKKNVVSVGILLWKCIYKIVDDLRQKYSDHPDWIFVKHEDLSLNSIEEFEKIFSKFNLKFTEKIKKNIIATTKSNSKNYLSRDSKQNITAWKNRLDENEIQRIKVGTKEIWQKFYTEEDW